jgi:hypothetical protein
MLPPSISYQEQISRIQDNPGELEHLYQDSKLTKQESSFREAIQQWYQGQPDHLLAAAWYYRLGNNIQSSNSRTIDRQWKIAIAASIVLGLVLWGISSPTLTIAGAPLIFFLWSPIIACALLAFLVLTSKKLSLSLIGSVLLLTIATAYALILGMSGKIGNNHDSQTILILLHLPLIAACALGLYILGDTQRSSDVHGFLWKGIEVIGIAGVYAIIGGIFAGLTLGLFYAIGITPNETILRLLGFGGGGLIPVLAVASGYQPELAPGDQDVQHGFSRLLSIAAQLLLPLGLLVVCLYLCFLPFNFQLIFTNRDTLIIYNVLLFAVVALLVVATPLTSSMLAPQLQTWIRRAIIALAILVTVICLHALAAIIYRTVGGGLTINRLAVIGWNSLNIGLLVAFLINQSRKSDLTWIERAQAVYRIGTIGYFIWGAAVLIGSPWILAN